MNLDSAVTNATNKGMFSGCVVDRTVFPQPSFSHTDFLHLINMRHCLHLLLLRLDCLFLGGVIDDGWVVCYIEMELNLEVAANNNSVVYLIIRCTACLATFGDDPVLGSNPHGGP
ncbi:hypothetical protein TSUD_206760 [Trifolium subterraneum]|uniref:Uncharacterized protein n=1 Tax=Trifolium subterraneum TaxID=3900 RepID=A0A2Z6NLP1_TRISU|nr:hypothetical protein TSUD_206760 [Trifolium subterraneum]